MRHIIVKLQKTKEKEKFLRAARGKKTVYCERRDRLMAKFLAEITEAKRLSNGTFNVLN